MLRFLTAGESHGPSLTLIIDGLPAGLPIDREFIRREMHRRQTGVGSGGRQLIENDVAEITSGVRFGRTLGSPIAITIANRDHAKWENKVVNPRPGHADLAGVQKYGFDDVRNVLERASARETAARVAAGAIFKQLLLTFGIDIASHTLAIGQVKLTGWQYDFAQIKRVDVDDPQTRCLDSQTGERMRQAIDQARRQKDTLGGIIEVWAVGVPPGLGSYAQFDRKIDGQIASALMSIPSVKAVEIGEAVDTSQGYGSQVQDEIFYDKKRGYFRKNNRAGGVEGGVTTGMPVVVRLYHKPISTLYAPLKTVNIRTKKSSLATVERSDICVVPRAGVVAEAMLSYVLADNLLQKFGGDNLEDITSAYNKYKKRIQK